jgi:hypothetical protein
MKSRRRIRDLPRCTGEPIAVRLVWERAGSAPARMAFPEPWGLLGSFFGRGSSRVVALPVKPAARGSVFERALVAGSKILDDCECETVMETIVNPISSDPCNAAVTRSHPCSR